VKVCDFGLSAVKPHGQTIKDETCIPGTPLWMAPEVMLGQALDEKSDVYSYGIVVWEIVTSQEPFLEYDSYPAFKRAICREDVRPPIPKDTLPSLRKLLEDCWDKDPKKRPGFDDIINRLDEIIIDATIADPTGRAFWKKNFFGKVGLLLYLLTSPHALVHFLTIPHYLLQEVVLYKDFVRLFADLHHLQPSADDLNFECLKAMLRKDSNHFIIRSSASCSPFFLLPSSPLALKDSDPTLRDPPLIVNIERFGHILEFFGPLVIDPAQPNNNILEKIKTTMKQPFVVLFETLSGIF
jgi:serine/threonine protein kinase